MCGRYLFKQDEDDELEEWLKNFEPEEVKDLSLHVVYPSQKTIVLTQGLKPMIAQWGHVKWDNKGRIINARSETIASSLFFENHLKKRRCLIKADGFYEWDKEKAKHLVTDASQNPFYMAGIYDEEGCFSILTNEVRTDFIQLHNRVPLMIPSNLLNKYLEDGDQLLEDFRKLKQNEMKWVDQSIQQRLF